MTSCQALCRPALCTAPPAPLTLNWGEGAFAALRGAVVGIVSPSDGASTVGTGFWISPRAVATAWSPALTSKGIVQVIASQALGPPIVLDAVVTFAVPALGIAFLTVNPLTVGGMLMEPTVLPIANDVATGQTVCTLTTSATGALTMRQGIVSTGSTTVSGYITDIVTSLPMSGSTVGAPVIRVPDNVVVGMVQHQALGADIGFSAGINGRTIAAAAYWATQESLAVRAPFVLGAATPVMLRPSVALGQLVTGTAGDEGPAPRAVLPMPTCGIQPLTVELGVPCNGAVVGVPVLPSASPNLFTPTRPGLTLSFYGAQTVVPAATAGASRLVVDTGYVRAHMPMVFTDISGTGTLLSMDSTTGAFNATSAVLGSAPGSRFMRLAAGAGATPTSLSAVTLATSVIVSSLGMVVLNYSFTVDPGFVETIISNPNPAYPYAAPFASMEFAVAVGSYNTNKGLPGGPLAVYMAVTNTAVTFQWQGFARTSGAPVQFQVVIGLDLDGPGNPETTSLTSGELTFAYGPDVMPGPWAGDKWLTGAQMGFMRNIVLPSPPSGGDAVYFGLANTTPSSSDGLSNMCAVLASDGASYLLGPHGEESVSGPLPSSLVGATVVVANTTAAAAPYFAYALFNAPAPSQLRTVAAVNGVPIGSSDLDTASLTDVLLRTALTSTAATPQSVAVQFRSVGFGPSVPLTPTGLTLFLGGAVALGQTPTFASPTSTSVAFVPPVLTLGPPQFLPGSYSGLVLTVPYSYVAATGAMEPQQAQLLSVQGTVTIKAADVIAYLANPLAAGEGSSALFIVSLAQTDGTLLTDAWPQTSDLAPPQTTLAVSIPAGDLPWTVSIVTSNGYGNTVKTVQTVTASGDVVVPFTLSYDPTLYTARVNGLVIGRPPVASFSPTYDPGFGVDGPSVLVPGTVALTSVVTATRSIVAAPDPSESYWVTGTPRAVTRDQVAGSFNY